MKRVEHKRSDSNSVLMRFEWISKQLAISSLNMIDSLEILIGIFSILCGRGTEFLNIILYDISLRMVKKFHYKQSTAYILILLCFNKRILKISNSISKFSISSIAGDSLGIVFPFLRIIVVICFLCWNQNSLLDLRLSSTDDICQNFLCGVKNKSF